MEQIIEKNVRFCGCCHRELPVDSFYVDKRTLAPDNYCKECRRAMSNARYRRSLPASNPLRYPVITEISDCTLRMYLILNALKVVRESVLRKRKRLCEAGEAASSGGGTPRAFQLLQTAYREAVQYAQAQRAGHAIKVNVLQEKAEESNDESFEAVSAGSVSSCEGLVQAAPKKRQMRRIEELLQALQSGKHACSKETAANGTAACVVAGYSISNCAE